MFANSIDEDVQLDAMQRIWQSKRVPSLFDESKDYPDFFASLTHAPADNKSTSSSPAPVLSYCEVSSEHDLHDFIQDPVQEVQCEDVHNKKCLTLNGSVLCDLPACYTIYGLKPYQQPVIGVYIDKRVCPGFKYKVQPLPASNDDAKTLPYLFGSKALTLRSIGRGYARRFTFESDKSCLNNDNYFWSDNRPEGFGFELELVSDGDKFTVFDANHEAQGTLEILKLKGVQVELSSEVITERIKKKAKINFIGKVEFYETGVAKPMPMFGIATSIKSKDKLTAQLVKISNVTIKHHRYYLTPGINKIHRRVTVRGDDIGDINTKYTMTGLESYELPVVGTYVDPRIIPGFCYRIRPNDRKDHLFNGRALRLCNIGIGYAKRLTFAPDSLISPDNYLWSDNHPDGLGLEPRAIHAGMKFSIMTGNQHLGEASVFRADAPQQEERMERVPTALQKFAIVKYIHVNVTCHVKLANTGGRSADKDEYLMRVYGLAIVRKDPNTDNAYIERVENVGLDSQLNILFAGTHSELVFYPLH